MYLNSKDWTTFLKGSPTRFFKPLIISVCVECTLRSRTFFLCIWDHYWDETEATCWYECKMLLNIGSLKLELRLRSQLRCFDGIDELCIGHQALNVGTFSQVQLQFSTNDAFLQKSGHLQITGCPHWQSSIQNNWTSVFDSKHPQAKRANSTKSVENGQNSWEEKVFSESCLACFR